MQSKLRHSISDIASSLQIYKRILLIWETLKFLTYFNFDVRVVYCSVQQKIQQCVGAGSNYFGIKRYTNIYELLFPRSYILYLAQYKKYSNKPEQEIYYCTHTGTGDILLRTRRNRRYIIAHTPEQEIYYCAHAGTGDILLRTCRNRRYIIAQTPEQRIYYCAHTGTGDILLRTQRNRRYIIARAPE